MTAEKAEEIDAIAGEVAKVASLIVEHTARADQLVTNTLTLGRQGDDKVRSKVDVGPLVAETCDLAWHGIRVHDKQFRCKVNLDVADVIDNGVGISAENRSHAFEPFFTTKPPGEGTGLGLSISREILTTEHNGHITLDSRLGEATEVGVRLPVGVPPRM